MRGSASSPRGARPGASSPRSTAFGSRVGARGTGDLATDPGARNGRCPASAGWPRRSGPSRRGCWRRRPRWTRLDVAALGPDAAEQLRRLRAADFPAGCCPRDAAAEPAGPVDGGPAAGRAVAGGRDDGAAVTAYEARRARPDAARAGRRLPPRRRRRRERPRRPAPLTITLDRSAHSPGAARHRLREEVPLAFVCVAPTGQAYRSKAYPPSPPFPCFRWPVGGRADPADGSGRGDRRRVDLHRAVGDGLPGEVVLGPAPSGDPHLPGPRRVADHLGQHLGEVGHEALRVAGRPGAVVDLVDRHQPAR